MSDHNATYTYLKSRITIKLWILFAVIYLCQTSYSDVNASGFNDILVMESGTMVSIEEEKSELDQLRQQFRDGKVLEARMKHEFLDTYTGESQITEGKIWISRKKYKIEADQQVVVVNGETSRVYNERQNKLVVSHYEPNEDDFAPSRFFSDVEDLYYVSEVIRADESITFVLKSEDAFEIFLEVRIVLDKSLKPLHISAVDQMENTLNTTLTEAGYVEYNDALFQLDYPNDAEIIDLRK